MRSAMVMSAARRLVAAMVCTACAAVAGVAGGCTSAEPPYPVEVMTFDEGLIGTWRARPEPGKGEDEPRLMLRVEAREVTVKEGRLDAGGMGTDGKRKDAEPRETRRAYLLGLDLDGLGAGPPLMGVMIRLGERTYLGLQVPPKRIDEAGLGGWVIPVHRLVMVERAGDVLTVRTARSEVVWVPGVGVLDGPGREKDTPRTLTAEKAGPHVTTEIDRVLEVLREAGGDAAWWSDAEKAVVLERVKP